MSTGGGGDGGAAHPVIDVMSEGLSFPEGPRWRDGRWWLSDQLGGRVLTLDEDGIWSVVAVVPRPSGLGFLPDGSIVVATMDPPRVMAVSHGAVEEIADLADLTTSLNDLVVDDAGRTYLDAYGEQAEPGRLLLMAPGQEPRVVAEDLDFPNGIVVTPDGRTLLVAETFGERISAFDIHPDGSLSGRRTWASLPGSTPDGICLDSGPSLWVASFRQGEFLRVHEGGRVVDRITLGDGRWAMACALGGIDGRTLLLCTATTTTRDYFAGIASGRVGLVRVGTPGSGRA